MIPYHPPPEELRSYDNLGAPTNRVYDYVPRRDMPPGINLTPVPPNFRDERYQHDFMPQPPVLPPNQMGQGPPPGVSLNSTGPPQGLSALAALYGQYPRMLA